MKRRLPEKVQQSERLCIKLLQALHHQSSGPSEPASLQRGKWARKDRRRLGTPTSEPALGHDQFAIFALFPST